MARILIAAGDVVTAQGIQGTLESHGHQTANVWDAMEMVEFCGQHRPDLIVLDLGLSEGRAWAAVQIMRREASMQTIPIFGLSSRITEIELEHAKALGLVGIEPMPSGADELFPALDRVLNQTTLQAMPTHPNAVPAAPSNAAEELVALVAEVRMLADQLAPSATEFGDDGPELFGFIDNSTDDILNKLQGYLAQGVDHATLVLQDREVRHDFRNMIGSVTGFAELILMESGIQEDHQVKFKKIRENSATFVSLLDQQKQVAAAA